MDFWFFKLKKWGKKTAETRRRNCAVLPKMLLSFGNGLHSPGEYVIVYQFPDHEKPEAESA